MSSRILNAVPPAFVSRPREELKEIAQDMLAAVRRGSYTVDDDSGGETYIIQDLSATPDSTTYFGPDAMGDWKTAASPKRNTLTDFVLSKATTLEGIRFCLANTRASSTGSIATGHPPRLSVLNFASGTIPGGNFRSGEEEIGGPVVD